MVTSHNHHAADRIKAVHALGRDLTPEQVERLRRVMNGRSVSPTLANEIFNKLVGQLNPPNDLMRDLAAIYRDKSRNARMREFCLQYVSACYPSADSQNRARGIALLQEAINANEAGSGTALTAMNLIANDFPELMPDVNKAVSGLVSGEDVHPQLKACAIEIAMKRQNKMALDTARLLSKKDGTELFLRLSSIAALGRLGNEADQSLLICLKKHNDDRIRRVAGNALSALEERIAENEVANGS